MMASGQNVSTPEEQAQLFNSVATREISWWLKVQAGRDLGFDPKMIERFVKDEHESRLERAESAANMADILKSADVDSGQYFADTESRVLAELWRRSVTGQFPGPDGRPYVDRFVRPGRLRLEFERRQASPEIGSMVELQMAVATPDRFGDLPECRRVLEDLIERVEAGDDFGDVAVELGCASPENRGVQPNPYEEALLRQLPEVGSFLAGAMEGDVSGVLSIRVEGALRGFRVVKLLKRDQESLPDFVDEEFQADLTERIRNARDKVRETIAVDHLLTAAYVWPPEAFGRKPSAGEGATPGVPAAEEPAAEAPGAEEPGAEEPAPTEEEAPAESTAEPAGDDDPAGPPPPPAPAPEEPSAEPAEEGDDDGSPATPQAPERDE